MGHSQAAEAGLYQRPRCFDAVQWSQDNLIAVASGAQVTVLSPTAPKEPRSCTPANLLALPVDGLFTSADAISRYRCHQLSQSDKAGSRATYVQALCWSPRGLQGSGECYLTLLSSTGSVSPCPRVFCECLKTPADKQAVRLFQWCADTLLGSRQGQQPYVVFAEGPES